MRSPGKRPLSFIAEYQFGEDNLLTATHHEELRIKNEERIRNAKSVLKLEGLTLSEDASPTYNAKKLQHEQDRQDQIDHHNLILLDRLERIHRHLPKQFDVSHHTESVQKAPRASNAGLRRRQQSRIHEENKRMKRRLDGVKGTFDQKQLAADAERHYYFSDQLSKVARRRKVHETCKGLVNHHCVGKEARDTRSFYVFDHDTSLLDKRENDSEDDAESRSRPTHKSLPAPIKLPPVKSQSGAARKYAPCLSPTVSTAGHSISASELLGNFN